MNKACPTRIASRWLHSSSKPPRTSKTPFYMLTMFPYPSGMLHMGHLRVFTINDVVARFHILKNHEIINPMGWDSFGLPAENAAIQHKVSPKEWTNDNISKMRRQIEQMSTVFDWSRELSTCSASYYKFTQLLFLWLYNSGLAYKKKQEINWDPVDQTVLANEQVDAKGRSWRSGALVERRNLNQWFLKITDFAESLDTDLELLENWPDSVKMMQKNWIGRSEGANIVFQSDNKDISVFTSRPETLFSVQYLAVSLDHKLVLDRMSEKSVADFVNSEKTAQNVREFGSETSKKGLKLNITVTHPLTGVQIPVYAAPYVLSGYGSGAVMGCPAHDQRDWDFWHENGDSEPLFTLQCDNKAAPFTSKESVLVNCPQEYEGLSCSEGADKIVDTLKALDKGSKTVNYRLRDWLISRQRYWGCPIPIIYCENCGMLPVPEENLPVLLPEDMQFTGKGNPLDVESFKKCECPSCHGPAKRETDTMDTFMDSSWYFFRYLDVNNTKEPFQKEIADKYMPAELYIGGIEHAILHLLYSRFISKFLFSIGKWSGGDMNGEPFRKLVSQGMVHGKTYTEPQTNRFLKPEELVFKQGKAFIRATGEEPVVSYEKMSKSKFNGVDPVEFISKYGADATRAHMLFQAPVEGILYWDEQKIAGIQRWLKKLTDLTDDVLSKVGGNLEGNLSLQSIELHLDTKSQWTSNEIELFNETQIFIGQMEQAFGKDLTLNTVISDYMKFTNMMQDSLLKENIDKKLILDALAKLLVAVAPVCPTVSEELWHKTHTQLAVQWQSIFEQEWPAMKPLKQANMLKYMVMIKGKFAFYHQRQEPFENSSTVLKEMMLQESGENLYKLTPLTDAKVIVNEAKKCVIFVPQKKH